MARIPSSVNWQVVEELARAAHLAANGLQHRVYQQRECALPDTPEQQALDKLYQLLYQLKLAALDVLAIATGHALQQALGEQAPRAQDEDCT